MFQLTDQEQEFLRSQIVISKCGSGGRRYLPKAFTEQGIAMLSSILKSERAIVVNIAIMRIFIKVRSFLMLEKNLTDRMDKLERGANEMFKVVFQRMDGLEEMVTPKLPSVQKKIGLK